MADKTPTAGRNLRHRALLVGAAGFTIVAVGVAALSAVASAAPGASGPSLSVPKSDALADVNPDKQPAIDPYQLKPAVSAPLSPAQLKAAALAWKAQDPNSNVVCLRPDGSVAGAASLDRVDPSVPLTVKAAAAVCARGYAGSRP